MIIGADYYESEEQRKKVVAGGGVPLGIGAGTTIKNCIVDKNARIGKNVTIENKEGIEVSKLVSIVFRQHLLGLNMGSSNTSRHLQFQLRVRSTFACTQCLCLHTAERGGGTRLSR